MPLCTSLFRGADGQSALQTCFQRFHSCVDLARQKNRSHEWLIASRNFDNQKSNTPTKEDANKVPDKVKQDKGKDDETTLEEQSNYNANERKRNASTALTPVPATVKVKVEDSKEGIVIEKVKKHWCIRMSRSRGGLSKEDFDDLSKFGRINDVKGDGNCGIYVAIEGLLNCLIAVKTDVKLFRRQVHDFIDKNRNEVLMNYSFSGKLLKDGTVRGKKRDDWIENDVMKRMWLKGRRYTPRAPVNSWVSANWHFPCLAVMYGVNFVWYDCDNHMTYLCVKVLHRGVYKEKPVEKKGFLKSSTMIIGSQWDKSVVCVFNSDHFLHLTEFLDCD